MRVIGKPLDKVAIGGFSSVAKKVPPIWTTLEQAGMTVALLSIPGSTPWNCRRAILSRGRWGGWGADFHALNFETKADLEQRVLQGREPDCFISVRVTQISGKPNRLMAGINRWLKQVLVNLWKMSIIGWGKTVYGLIIDSTDDATVDYDQVIFSFDKKKKWQN